MKPAIDWGVTLIVVAIMGCAGAVVAWCLSGCGGEAFTVGDGTSEAAPPALLVMVTPDGSFPPLADGGSEESAPSSVAVDASRDRADRDAQRDASPLGDGGSEESPPSPELDAADAGERPDAPAPPDSGRVLVACSVPAECPVCGVIASPCCSGGYCGCIAGGIGACVR